METNPPFLWVNPLFLWPYMAIFHSYLSLPGRVLEVRRFFSLGKKHPPGCWKALDARRDGSLRHINSPHVEKELPFPRCIAESMDPWETWRFYSLI